MKNGKFQTSIFLLAAPPVNHFQSQDLNKDSKIQEEISPSYISPSSTNTDLPGACGKTFQVSCSPMEEGILVPSSGVWGNSGTGGPTESWTHNTSESPNGVVESSLSDILETQNVPQKFYLTQRALKGLLERTDKASEEWMRALKKFIR